MQIIKPIALKEAKILSNEEMKHLFGGSATTLTCSFTCEGGESVSASGCARCVANDNGGICYYPTGSAAALLCKIVAQMILEHQVVLMTAGLCMLN